MLVREIMSTDIVSVDIGESLRKASYLMLSERVGSVVVLEEGDHVGILTESDALKAAVKTDKSLGVLPVEKYMSRPLLTTSPDVTVQAAAARMRDEDVKKLAVTDGLELAGIVTMADIVNHTDELIKEAHELEEAREGWGSPGEHLGYGPE